MPSTLIERPERIATRPVAKRTEQVYERKWARFVAWCADNGFGSPPVSPDVAAGWMSALLDEGAKRSTLAQAHAALLYGTAHLPGVGHEEYAALKARLSQWRVWALHQGAPKCVEAQAAPLDHEAWRRIRKAYTRRLSELRLKRMGAPAWRRKQKDDWNATERRLRADLALIAVMRDGLLRRSEAAALDWEDLERAQGAKDGSGIVRRSKTDQRGEGRVFYVSAWTWNLLFEMTPDPAMRTGALFLSRFGARISVNGIVQVIKRAVKRAGYDPALYSGHSPRVGTAQDLMRAQESTAAIQLAGGWSSPAMVVRYTRRIGVLNGAVARLRRRQEAISALA